MKLQIDHLPERGRFQTVVEGMTCVADYRLSNGVMTVTHTAVVAPALEGRGIAGQLVQALLEYASAHGLKVMPQCSFARAYVQRHPETAPLLA